MRCELAEVGQGACTTLGVSVSRSNTMDSLVELVPVDCEQDEEQKQTNKKDKKELDEL